MLLETIRGLIQAGTDALETACGLTVVAPHVTLVKQGTLTFPALGELHIRNGTVQRVHLGCDAPLGGHLAGLAGESGRESGVEILAQHLLRRLLEEMEGRNPRGVVANVAVAPKTLTTRGLRTFGFRLETEAGQLFLLAEIPARGELESARSADFVAAMAATYLPRDWNQRSEMTSRAVIDNFLVFVRKVEQDIYFEVPGPDGVAAVHPGFLIGSGMVDGRRALKLCTDLVDAGLAAPVKGDRVRASTGLGGRSLEFHLEFLGDCTHPVADAELSCAWFGLPDELTVIQRRRAFRMPLSVPIAVDVVRVGDKVGASPWGDGTAPTVISAGRLRDLSFSGARIRLLDEFPDEQLQVGRRIVCGIHFPESFEPLRVSAEIRRSTLGLADRNAWQGELGVEFVVAAEADRNALEIIRDHVLAMQRAQLSQRIQVAGLPRF